MAVINKLLTVVVSLQIWGKQLKIVAKKAVSGNYLILELVFSLSLNENVQKNLSFEFVQSDPVQWQSLLY